METETVIIIGRSPFVTAELLTKIRQQKCIKVAINQSLTWCDYIAHLDRGSYNYGKAIPLTSIAFDNIDSPEKYNVTSKNVIYDKGNNALRSCGFTHDFVVSWAWLKGFDKIIMAGAADFINGGHYNNGQIFNLPPHRVKESINYLCTFDNIYTLNPNSAIGYNRVIELI